MYTIREREKASDFSMKIQWRLVHWIEILYVTHSHCFSHYPLLSTLFDVVALLLLLNGRKGILIIANVFSVLCVCWLLSFKIAPTHHKCLHQIENNAKLNIGSATMLTTTEPSMTCCVLHQIDNDNSLQSTQVCWHVQIYHCRSHTSIDLLMYLYMHQPQQ